MDASGYLRVLRKRWWIIVTCVVVGIALSAAYVETSTKIYTSSAQIFVAATAAADQTPNNQSTNLNNGNTFAEARVQSYTAVVNSPTITDAVVKDLNLPYAPTVLAGKITADAPLNKVLLNIHVTDRSPVLAARIANAVATQASIAIPKIESVSAGASVVKLTVIHPAQVPSKPTSPKTTLDLLLGLLAGLLIGLGLASLRENLDTRIRTAADVGETIDASVLAVVPTDKRASASPVAFRGDDRSPRSESFRQLRTNLQYIAVDSPPKLIAITSAVSGEGKSMTAVNLASAMAEAGLKVCLIDADLRRPTIAKYLGLVAGAGLTSVLAGKASVGDVLQPVGPNMTVITSGPIPPNPSELLATAHFRSVLHDLVAQTDYVLVDTAPLLPVADGSEVASAADVTLLVVRAGRTNRDQLRQGFEALNKVGAHLGGVVFNMVSSRDSGVYYEYYSTAQPTRSS